VPPISYRLGRVIGIAAIRDLPQLPYPHGILADARGRRSRQKRGGDHRAPLAILLACGCGPERPPRPTPGEVIVAAGDIGTCSGAADEATARLAGGIDASAVLTLGDEAYPEGTAQEFDKGYKPTWGRFENRTRPVPDNHEYNTEGAEGYFGYFGKAAGEPGEGYYSYDLGGWHMVALNSNCEEVGCGASSPQVRWLKADLAKNAMACTLAYFHYPLFSSGSIVPAFAR
jgi:hypothetical protein